MYAPAIEWHRSEAERLRSVKTKSKQLRQKIMFHEMSAHCMEGLDSLKKQKDIFEIDQNSKI